jgi:mRNA interferase MazF
MITRATRSSWPYDVRLTDWKEAGLKDPCVVRMKLFTLSNKLIVKQIGRLAVVDTLPVRQALADHLGMAGEHL